MEEIKMYYLDENKESQEGVFKIRRLVTDEATNIYELCQRKHPKTGEVVGEDTVKYSKMRLAASIVDCPITNQGQAWKDITDISIKTQLIGQRLEDDMFVYLVGRIKKMSRLTEETENL